MVTQQIYLPQRAINAKALYRGDEGEDVIAYILRRENFYVTITADINERGRGGAPGMRNDNNFLTLPDLLLALQGCSAWAEVKSKAEADWTRITQRYEHGIGLRKLNYYNQVSEQSGLPVLLFIYEYKSGAVLFSDLDDLPPPRIYEGNKMDPGGMAFWPRASFDLWGKVAIAGDEFYHQLGLFEQIEGQGGKVYEVLRHKLEALIK